jgi:hypothetical protein
VRVVWHTINRDQFLLPLRYDSGDVFLQFLFPIRSNHARPTRNREDDMKINLCVGVRHREQIHMPPLTGLICVVCRDNYKHGAPAALSAGSTRKSEILRKAKFSSDAATPATENNRPVSVSIEVIAMLLIPQGTI